MEKWMKQDFNDTCPKCSGLFRKGKLKKIIGRYTDGHGNKVSGVYRCHKCNYTTTIYDKVNTRPESNLQDDKKLIHTCWTAGLNTIEKSDTNPLYDYAEKVKPKLKKEWTRTSAPIEEIVIEGGSAKPNFPLINNNKKLQQQREISTKKSNLNPNKTKIDWSNIIGYEEIKHIIDAVLINKNVKKTHVLIAGHAGTSKTVFLKTIESSLLAQGHNVHYLDATTLSSSGVVEYMFSNDVTYCLLDELDKLEKEHQSTFLNLLESGILQETKHKKIRKKEMKDTIVIATGNYIEKIMFPLVTRFLTLNIPKYTKDQFYDISIKLLTSQYGKTDEIAYYIADQIWKIYTEKRKEEPNMRQCVQVASLTDNTKESIDPILQGIATYSLKAEE